MLQPELLVPAGDMEKLITALNYGADAVYLGGESFGLRAHAGNFSLEELAQAKELVQRRGKKLYLTLNATLRPGQEESLVRYLGELRPLDLHAYIVSDPGVLSLVREHDPGRAVHLSTQANTTNSQSINFWKCAGVSRVNLARELTLEEIQAIGASSEMELEAFVHGAMCVAYSGRCLLSAALTGRSANQGSCVQPCRWGYSLTEESRPGQHFPIEEDGSGTYIMNSRDLCLVEHLPELLKAGVSSLKIEGRMKGAYYVAAVTRVYRAALDRYLADPEGFVVDPAWRQELEKVSHRPYGTGFLFGKEDPQVHSSESVYLASQEFVGVVLEVYSDGRALVGGRNRFFPGDPLELMGPGMRQAAFDAGGLTDERGKELAACQPNSRILMELPSGAEAGDFLRKGSAE